MISDAIFDAQSSPALEWLTLTGGGIEHGSYIGDHILLAGEEAAELLEWALILLFVLGAHVHFHNRCEGTTPSFLSRAYVLLVNARSPRDACFTRNWSRYSSIAS